MSFGVNETGFVKKTYTDIKGELEQYLLSKYPTLDLDPRGTAGHLIAMSTKGFSDAWEELEGLFGLGSPSRATGASLDANYAILDLTRIDASSTEIGNVIHWTTSASPVLIPTGSKARQSGTGRSFTLQGDVTILDSSPEVSEYEPSTTSAGQIVSIGISGTTYTYTIKSGDTKEIICEALRAALANNVNTEVLTSPEGTLRILGGDTAIVNLDKIRHGAFGTYLCDETGSLSCPQNTLDTIVTPITDWDSVENIEAGALGRDGETDAEYRQRAATYFLFGYGTEEGIRQYILNTIEGVLNCNVRSNRTGLQQGSLPANCLEVVVSGGVDQDLADAIWQVSPGGIQLYGLTTMIVTDSNGDTQTVGFTRPSVACIWVKVLRSLNEEEAFPSDGDRRIQEAIVEWASSFYQAGRNVYARDLLTPINTITGLGDVVVQFGNSLEADTAPTAYSGSPVILDYSKRAEFLTGRIVVEAL